MQHIPIDIVMTCIVSTLLNDLIQLSNLVPLTPLMTSGKPSMIGLLWDIHYFNKINLKGNKMWNFRGMIANYIKEDLYTDYSLQRGKLHILGLKKANE